MKPGSIEHFVRTWLETRDLGLWYARLAWQLVIDEPVPHCAHDYIALLDLAQSRVRHHLNSIPVAH